MSWQSLTICAAQIHEEVRPKQLLAVFTRLQNSLTTSWTMFLTYELFGVHPKSYDAAHSFVRSSFIPTIALALLRLLISIYAFSTIVVGYTWQAYNLSYLNLKDVNIHSYLVISNQIAIGRSFSYFTWLCFWSQAFYFLVSGAHTLVFSRRGRTWLHDERCPTVLQLCHSLWYTTVTTYPFLVSIVFWCTMYSGPWPTGRYEQWLNLSVHGLNSLFALIEIILPATQRPPIAHLAVLLVVLSLYLGLAYLTKATQDFYVYEWLNPAHGNLSIIIHILGYAGGVSCIFALHGFGIHSRSRLAERLSTKATHGQAKEVRVERLPSARASEERIWDHRMQMQTQMTSKKPTLRVQALEV